MDLFFLLLSGQDARDQVTIQPYGEMLTPFKETQCDRRVAATYRPRTPRKPPSQPEIAFNLGWSSQLT